MILDRLAVPIVLAPMAGGPATPALAAAVSDAGGLGFLAAGYRSPQQLAEDVAAARALSDRPLAVNVFSPTPAPTDPADYEPYLDRLRAAGEPIGEARFDDDAYAEKIELLAGDPPAVVSFTFGCPDQETIRRLRDAGSEVWVTVTAPEEAVRAEHAGADVLVVQGAEAGGHRGSWQDRADLPVYGLLALLQLTRPRVRLPLVATGGIATAAAVRAVLSAGAAAAQAGTAFMLCPEAGTAPVHRDALRSSRDTVLTRAFTGRLARGIRNRWTDSYAGPVAYPEVHHATAALRRAARETGDDGAINLWTGQAHELAEELPAAEVVARLAAGASSPPDGIRDRRDHHAG